MIHILNYCPCIFIKQWYMPFCAFFTTFTVVMTILILSTDLKVGRHYIRFNSSYLWDFEEISQEDPRLSSLIREKYFKSPILGVENKPFIKKPSVHIFNVFRKKRFGIFMECGSNGKGDTEWLEKVLSWEGLLTQAEPDKFRKLVGAQRRKSHLAQVCISPTTYPKHAYFKLNDSSTAPLKAVPCFPLYSLMRAYNTSHLDVLSFTDLTPPIQVLKTLPVRLIRIKVIMLQNSEWGGGGGGICCDPELTTLLDKWGYRPTSHCESFQENCYFLCSRTYCPALTED